MRRTKDFVLSMVVMTYESRMSVTESSDMMLMKEGPCLVVSSLYRVGQLAGKAVSNIVYTATEKRILLHLKLSKKMFT